ncbi:hypothetical protein DL770_006480 [Monosporascus sp. CRB-9-2]|nr:hypothetical protein DL770_006480 [Monosporascus sp. CRB-9-2]
MAPLAGAFGGLLSLLSFFALTDPPETVLWLSQEEKYLAIARVKSERVAQASVLDNIDRKKLWLGFSNPVGLAFFTPGIVGTIYPAYSTVQKQLYTVPPYVVDAFFEALLPLLSWRFNRRQVFIVMTVPLAIVVSDTSRTISLPTNMMFGNIGGLIATCSYLSWDGPNYPIGYGLNLAALSLILIISSLTLLWMTRDSKRREQRDIDDALPGSGAVADRELGVEASSLPLETLRAHIRDTNRELLPQASNY